MNFRAERKTNKHSAVATAFVNASEHTPRGVQFADNRNEFLVQRKIQNIIDKSNRTQQVVQLQNIIHTSSTATVQKKENKTGLPDQLKSGVEQLSGISMSDVKVHFNSSQPAKLQAHAFAQGTNIHIAPGQEKHLPHEAWHVVQQKLGRVRPTLQMKGKININDDKGLEQEADVMGTKALQFQSNKFPAVSTNKTIVNAPVQLKPISVMVTGLSHLVEMRRGSIYEGIEGPEIIHGQRLLIDTDKKYRSRRGPNQERYAGDDQHGPQVYRWFKVLIFQKNNLSAREIYVREDAFVDAPAHEPNAATDSYLPPNTHARALPSLLHPVDQEKDSYRDPADRAMDRLSRELLKAAKSKAVGQITPHIAMFAFGQEVHAAVNSGKLTLTQKQLDVAMAAYNSVHHGSAAATAAASNFDGAAAAASSSGGAQAVDPRSVKDRKKIEATIAGSYHPVDPYDPARMAAVASAMKSPQLIRWHQLQKTGRPGPSLHAEVSLHPLIQQKYAELRARGGKRVRKEIVHISGVLRDCLFCHWSHDIFNLTIGHDLNIAISSAGTHGKPSDNWQVPSWILADPIALNLLKQRIQVLATDDWGLDEESKEHPPHIRRKLGYRSKADKGPYDSESDDERKE